MNCIKEVKRKSSTQIYNWLILLIIFLAFGCAHKSENVDLIIHNANIYTLDENNTTFSAIAIREGIIIDIGAERYILNKYKAKNKIDAQMKPVYPGFIDSHCHFIGYGLSLSNINLVGTTSFNEVIEKVVNSKQDENQIWIQGRGWDQNDWKEKEYPTKDILDSIYPNTPVILRRIDGHAAIVNQNALDIAGINIETVIDNGEIVVKNGKLTGLLIDGAVELLMEKIPPPNNKFKENAILQAQKRCFEVGLTTVDDAGISKSDVFLLDSLHEIGKLRMRIYAMLTDSEENFDYFLEKGPYKTDFLNVCSFKFYADGALGSRGAALLSEYSDLSNHFGFIMKPKEYYLNQARKVYEAGFQMNTHCIGDSANRLILDVYAEVLKRENDFRWRIEHAQVVSDIDVNKFANYSIIPSVQPSHATSDMSWVENRLGKSRVETAYAYKKLKEQLGFIVIGTDFPVESINPIHSFYAAVFRNDENNYPKNGFQMTNSLSRLEALKGMTTWGALANREYEEKGSLEIGKFADIIVLSNDILNAKRLDVLNTEVLYTIIDGEIVFER